MFYDLIAYSKLICMSGAIKSKQDSINGMSEGVENICFQAFLS